MFPIVESSASTSYSANQTSHAVDLPSGVSSGDLLLLWFCMDSTTGTVTTPTGWNLEEGPLLQTDRSILYSRIADGLEGATVTVATSTSESSTAIAVRISGADNFITASGSAPSGIMANPTSVTATASAESILLCFGSSLGAITVPEIANGPLTEVFQAGNSADTNNTVSCELVYANRTTTAEEEVAVLPWRWSQSVAHRTATVLVHGMSSAIAAGFPLSRTFNTGC